MTVRRGSTAIIIPLQNYITNLTYITNNTLQNRTVCLRPQIAKGNRGGRSYTQSVVKLVIKYNNIRLNTAISD